MKTLRGSKINQLLIADDFYEAYERCKTANNENKIVMIPAFANGLFACELYLKYLSNKSKKEHNLKILFEALDEEKRHELQEVKCVEGYTLENLLNGIGNGFEVWRYCFEDKHKEFEEKFPFAYSKCFLETYLPVLKKIAYKEQEKTKK